MPNICSNTPIKDEIIKGLRAELNFIRKSICSLQAGGGGGGNTIYTGDGSLSGDRVVALNGHNLLFTNGDEGYGISIEASAGNITGIDIVTSVETGLGNGTHFKSNADDVSATAYMQAGFNDGEKSAKILLQATAIESTATYTADTHTFNGDVVIDNASHDATITLNGSPFNTIYTGDGSLGGNRILDLGSNKFEIRQGGQSFLLIDPTVDAENSFFGSINNTGGGNSSGLSTLTPATLAQFQLGSNFNDGQKVTSIYGFADATGSSITCTADNHTFNGVLNLTIQAAPALPNDGDIWREDNTNTGLKIRVNGTTKTITLS